MRCRCRAMSRRPINVKTKMSNEEVERFSLEQMTILAHSLEIISEQEKAKIDDLRRLRNALIHANAGKISQMIRRRYEGLGSKDFDEATKTTLYLASIPVRQGISSDSLKYLLFVTDLTVKFYGEEVSEVEKVDG